MVDPAWSRSDALKAGVISTTDPGFYDIDRENEVFRHCRVKVAWFWFEPLKPEDVPFLRKISPAPEEPSYAKEIFARERRRWAFTSFLSAQEDEQ